MITRFEIKNFRMLRANAASLSPFVVLVGKNATGKSTLMGAIRFISDLLKGGVQSALSNALERDAPNFVELCFRPDEPIEIALEVALDGKRARYEVRIGPDASGAVSLAREHLFLLPDTQPAGSDAGSQLDLWDVRDSIWDASQVVGVHERVPLGWRKVVAKTEQGKDYFQDERTSWNNVFRWGTDKAALGGIPEDHERFPFAIRVRDFLRDGVRAIELDSRKLREPSLPRSPTALLPDGSNLARAAAALRERDPVAFNQWVDHVGSAIDGLRAIDVWERPEDKRLVLQAHFAGHHGDPVPSWLLSDGTLRLLALSLLSYAGSEPSGVALIEEPENGLHPLAMQAVYDALSQPAEGGQVLVATHSPVILAYVTLPQTLVFRRLGDGSAQIRRGTEVPELRDWKSTASLADVFATGVLA
jgi:predicted ATPase